VAGVEESAQYPPEHGGRHLHAEKGSFANENGIPNVQGPRGKGKGKQKPRFNYIEKRFGNLTAAPKKKMSRSTLQRLADPTIGSGKQSTLLALSPEIRTKREQQEAEFMRQRRLREKEKISPKRREAAQKKSPKRAPKIDASGREVSFSADFLRMTSKNQIDPRDHANGIDDQAQQRADQLFF